jgi:cytochrome c oxidase subunit II
MRTSSWKWSWIALIALALPAFPARARAEEGKGAPDGAPRVVDITAKRFEFNPKEITLKRGEKVTLRLTSADVTHGFFQKELGIDLEIIPGKTAEVTITPVAAGSYTIICDHFCGSGHGNMKMKVVVQEAANAATR